MGVWNLPKVGNGAIGVMQAHMYSWERLTSCSWTVEPPLRLREGAMQLQVLVAK